MRRIYDCCCGIDVHKKMVVVCLIRGGERTLRTVETMTADLLELIDWLQAAGCQMVAMESTGSYWKPLYNLLEAAAMPVMVVNAHAIKQVPGRKSDVKDAEWIADLLQHGLLRASFIPDRDQREVAELVRYRRSLVEMRTAEVNRIQKVLEGANIKLGSVISNVLGVSGRAMLEQLIAGEEDGVQLAQLARPSLRASKEAIARAAQGRMGAHQRFLLQHQVQVIDALSLQIAAMEQEISTRLAAEEPVIERLQTIPGVGRQTAVEILAAIGTDMSRFPSHRHLASWAKLCPGMNQSAGRRGSGATGKGHRFLRAALTEAAHAAARSPTSTGARYRRLRPRLGGKRTAIAVAHSILIAAYYIIRDGTTYQDLGVNYVEQHDKDRIIQRSKRRIEQFGKEVTITDAA